MTKKQEQELLAAVEVLKLQQAKSDAHAEDQARTITHLNQKVRQTQQRDGEGVAWENLDPNKDYDYFGSFTIEGVEYGICLANTWKNSDRLIKSKSGKKGQRINVFPFKKGAAVSNDDAESGRYDDVVVNKDHSLEDGDKPTHERGE